MSDESVLIFNGVKLCSSHQECIWYEEVCNFTLMEWRLVQYYTSMLLTILFYFMSQLK